MLFSNVCASYKYMDIEIKIDVCANTQKKLRD